MQGQIYKGEIWFHLLQKLGAKYLRGLVLEDVGMSSGMGRMGYNSERVIRVWKSLHSPFAESSSGVPAWLCTVRMVRNDWIAAKQLKRQDAYFKSLIDWATTPLMQFFLFTLHLSVFMNEEVLLKALSVREFRVLKILWVFFVYLFVYQVIVNRAECICWERQNYWLKKTYAAYQKTSAKFSDFTYCAGWSFFFFFENVQKFVDFSIFNIM